MIKKIKRWVGKSIVNRLALYLVLALTFVFIIYGSISLKMANNFFQKSSQELIVKDAQLISGEIESFIGKYLLMVEQMATNKDFINIINEVDDRYEKRSHPSYALVVDQLNRIRLLDDKISTVFLALKLEGPDDLITNIYDYDSRDDFDLDSRMWYLENLKKTSPTVTSPYIDFITGENIISVSMPIYDGDKDIGAVALDIKIDDIYDYMEDYRIGDEGYSILVEKNANILYHPRKEYTLNQPLPDYYQFQNFTSEIEDLWRNEKTFFNKINGDHNYYVAYHGVSNTDWIVGTLIHESEVYAPMSSYIAINLFLLILSMLVLIFIVNRLTYWINKPLKLIAEDVSLLNYNNIDLSMAKEYNSRRDEIGMLAKAIIEASEKINKYTSTLDRKNKDLAKEISSRRQIQVKLEMILKLLSNTRESSFILDQDFTCLYYNKALESLMAGEKIQIGKTNFYSEGIFLNKEILDETKEKKYWNGEINIGGDFQKIGFIKFNEMVYKDSTFYVGIITDITEYKESLKEIFYFKNFDPLTKLQNKEFFEENCINILKNEYLSRDIHGLIIININGFRFINQAKGFDFGNKVLIEVSNKIKNSINSQDLLARLGNDEFVILKISSPRREDLYEEVKNLSKKLNGHYTIDDYPITIDFNIGVSIYPSDGNNYVDLFNKSLAALNNSKNSPHIAYQFYNKDISYEFTLEYEMKNKLAKALENKELEIYYQPQIDIFSEKIIGLEALLRWTNNGKSISPNVFIPLAEDSNLIIPIGEWVLENACNFAKKLEDQGREIKVAVNISSIQFRSEYLPSLVKKVLDDSRLRPDLLELEITESLLMANDKDCQDILLNLKKIGVQISIDDFGTGYSSLSYLQKFSVDAIKIDRNFVKGYPEKDNGIIAKIIIQLSQSLNLDVLAEGVESIEQIDFLKENNCKKCQGYYYSKPLSKEDLLDYLSQNKI